ncbi:MAG: hypothetical protein BWY52_02867 [Chloroflexi bacterium ADurb.Bin325]|nr:MAG: hypothetical protein BWY52_02867 [Chloroflexi bacterium ADurb.Bin325]
MTVIGIDPGAGALKVYGPAGGAQIPAILAVDEGHTLARMIGLTQHKPPLRIRTENGSFFVGAGAHEWGRPLSEDLDHDRFTGSPELRAVLAAGFTVYVQAHEPLAGPLTIYLGLPLEALSEETGAAADGVRRWLVGNHTWQADGRPLGVTVEAVKITSQAAGALFDYLLDDAGAFIPARKAHFDKEIGVISVGMNTVELLVTRSGAPQDRFTAGRTAGVRRLLDLVNPGGLYSLGELDTQLRAGKLDIAAALPVWEREVISFVERRWGQAYRRFAAIIVVGGGALLLRHRLVARFNARAFVPDDPVLATARGLYKLAAMTAARRRS